MRFRLLLIVCLLSITASANNMLVQNVTTLNNDAVNKTIQVQFDISWDNSWRDSINYDAAWVFIKFKDANGLWQHAQLNQTGFNVGTGTADSIKVTTDKVGTWVYRSGLGSGTFNVTGMQLQWNYGLSGLNSVTGLEVRVFAVEMVYVPEGEFNCAKSFYSNYTTLYTFEAPGANFPIINSRITPSLSYNDGTASLIRIKGDVGIDTNIDGIIDNVSYPIGYRAFYCFKYETTEQQYADFLNTLTSSQITTLGVAGTGITLNNGQYFSSTPNKACVGLRSLPLNTQYLREFLAYADWAGIRPISFTEINKVSYGPIQPVYFTNYGYVAWGSMSLPNSYTNTTVNDVGYSANSTSDRATSGASYYGVMNLTGNGRELVVRLSYLNFTSQNGNGILGNDGNNDIASWTIAATMIMPFDQGNALANSSYVFRYVRSSE